MVALCAMPAVHVLLVVVVAVTIKTVFAATDGGISGGGGGMQLLPLLHRTMPFSVLICAP